jgi:hypothetical protein
VASPISGRQRVCFVSVLPGRLQVPKLFIPVLGINASGEIRMTETTQSVTKGLPHAVKATARRRCSFVRPMFHYGIVSGGASLPGAVPHQDRRRERESALIWRGSGYSRQRRWNSSAKGNALVTQPLHDLLPCKGKTRACVAHSGQTRVGWPSSQACVLGWRVNTPSVRGQ